MTQNTRTDRPIRTHTEYSYGALKAFYFAHKTTGDLACEDLRDYNVDAVGSQHLGSEVRNTVTQAKHMTTELRFPAGFQMVEFGFRGSKEAVRTSRGWDRAIT